MEEELVRSNIRLLGEQVRRSGFPESVLPAMREKILAGKENEFFLPYAQRMDGYALKGDLYFQKWPDRQLYLMPYYSLELPADLQAPISENIFKLGTGYDLTLREAFNLMQGRSVYREPVFDQARESYWASLNMKEQWMGFAKLEYEKSEFRVWEGIERSPLARLLRVEEKAALEEALKKGDRSPLEVEVMGVKKKIWAEAAPGVGMIRFTNAKSEPVFLPELKPERRVDHQGHGKGRGR